MTLINKIPQVHNYFFIGLRKFITNTLLSSSSLLYDTCYSLISTDFTLQISISTYFKGFMNRLLHGKAAVYHWYIKE